MSIRVEECSETGICSIVKSSTCKADLLPTDVAAIREADGNAETIRKIIAESDANFADTLADSEIDAIVAKLSS